MSDLLGKEWWDFTWTLQCNVRNRLIPLYFDWWNVLRHHCKTSCEIKWHIYARATSNIIGLDNGLSPGRCQGIINTNAAILSNAHLETDHIEILINISTIAWHCRQCVWKCRLSKLGHFVPDPMEWCNNFFSNRGCVESKDSMGCRPPHLLRALLYYSTILAHTVYCLNGSCHLVGKIETAWNLLMVWHRMAPQHLQSSWWRWSVGSYWGCANISHYISCDRINTEM